MAKKNSYQDDLKEHFNKLFVGMKLDDEVKRYFWELRWLEQVLWMEGKANFSRNRYYFWRLTTIIGGVILPALISLNINTTFKVDNPQNNTNFRNLIIGSTFVISQLVAISAAVEEFFHYGERWRHYRRTVESLKTQGWQFSQLTGPYRKYKNHEEAFNFFAGQVEDIIQRDVEIYATQVVQEKKEEHQSQENYILIPNAKITNIQEKKEEEQEEEK